ncbi:hypothetical protein [Micromonospora chersina]|uniref:hypothetical protein n=1 Tax=Micromonospora chersina TaxID=47854 RepID=UPI00371D6691
MGTQLLLYLSEDGAEPERVQALARQLRQELLELDVEAVSAVTTGEAPEGSRAMDATTVGALLVSLGSAGPFIGPVVGLIQHWLSRASHLDRTVRVEIDGDVLVLGGASDAERSRLVDMYVQRHSAEVLP